MALLEGIAYGREGTKRYGVHEEVHSSGARFRYLPDYGAIPVGFWAVVGGRVISVIDPPLPEYIPGDMMRRNLLFGLGPDDLMTGLSFNVDDIGQFEDRVKIQMSAAYPGDRPDYPHPFDINTSDAFNKNTYARTVSILNTGDEAIPFELLWHPYLLPGSMVDDLHLRVTSSEKTGNEFASNKSLRGISLDRPFMVCDPDTDSGMIVSASVTDPTRRIEVQLFQTYNMPVTRIFIADTRDLIAVEPSTLPLLLAPGQTETMTFGLSVNDIGVLSH